MLRDDSTGTIEGNGWTEGASTETVTPASREVTCDDWREIDRTLVGQAMQRAALDAEEALWLRAGYRAQIWRHAGYISMVDYMERRLGYGVRAAQDRLRVAVILDEQPALSDALATGDLKFTGLRALLRVATPETETDWLEASRDKSVHEIEDLVSGHEKGDRPADPKKPELELRVLRYTEIRPATVALEREALAKARKEHGGFVTHDQFLAMVFGAYVAGEAAVEDMARAKYQVAVTLCPQCDQGSRDSAGKQFALDAADVARARCDAQHIGSLDTNAPERATQDIPPRVRRLIKRRDHGKCSLKDCRSAANLELHHIIAREDGGTHTPENILNLCDFDHRSLHLGLLTITGHAPDKLVVTRRHEIGAHVSGPSRLDQVTMLVEAKSALVKLGYKRPEAAAAVEAARASVSGDVTLDVLIREALKRCMKPK